MPIYTLPTGERVFFSGTQEEMEAQQKIIQHRFNFTRAYALLKGWPTDVRQLSIDQILEIQACAGWKNPGWKAP